MWWDKARVRIRLKHLSNYLPKINCVKLTVNEKIKESEFFLQKIKDYYRTQDVEYYLHAFLCSSRSIPDHLLEDYNQKFGFNIDLEERNFDSKFREKAEENSDAKKFLQLYDKKITDIKTDEIGRYMWIKRNIAVHRSNLTFDGRQLEASESITAFADVGCFDLDNPEEMRQKAIERLRDEKQKELKPKSSPPVRVSNLLQILDKYVKVENACERFLSLMKNMVSDIKKEFP